MNRYFLKSILFLAIAAFGFAMLSTPGDRFVLDVQLLKILWMCVLGYATGYTIYRMYRGPRRPPNI